MFLEARVPLPGELGPDFLTQPYAPPRATNAKAGVYIRLSKIEENEKM